MESTFQEFATRILNERITMMQDLETQRNKVRILEQFLFKSPYPAPEAATPPSAPLTPKRRGRPLGSKNKPKTTVRKVEITV